MDRKSSWAGERCHSSGCSDDLCRLIEASLVASIGGDAANPREDDPLSDAAPATDQAPRIDVDAQRVEETGYAWERLEDQLRWYDRNSAHHKDWFQRLKVLQIVIAAAIPLAAGADASAWVTGSLGAAIVVLEGFQQLFQFQQNWVGYRATAEALKHEKFLYLAHAGPYREAPARDALLAERVEGLVSQEHAVWSSAQTEAGPAQR